MSAITQLSQQLSALQESLKQSKLLIDRLANLALQPGSEPLDEDEGSARIELAQDIHDSLKQIDEDLDLLKSETDELKSESSSSRRKDTRRDQDRDQIIASVDRFEEDLSASRAHFRQAQLRAEKASKVARARERELVFKSIVEVTDEQEPSVRHKRQRTQQLSKDEVLVNATSDVTAALRRTHDLLSTELTRSRFAQETFDQSTEALKELGEKYSNLDTILANSRNLLSTLLRSQKSDTWYLETAFYILVTTLVWLVFRRLLYGPFWKLPQFLWRIFAFLLNWTVLRPLYLFLTLVGVIRTERVPLRSAEQTTTRSRAPLIIQPSASDFIPRSDGAMAEELQKGKGVPAGAGGAGAKVPQNPGLAGKASEAIAQLRQQTDSSKQEAAEPKEQIKRGDGTVLQDRGEIPANPRKKVFEADKEDKKQGTHGKDEL